MIQDFTAQEARQIFDSGVHHYGTGYTDKARASFRKYLSFYKVAPTLPAPSETDLRRTLDKIAPRVRLDSVTPSLLTNLIQSQLLICDLEAANELAFHLERWVAHIRRAASERGTLAVLFEDYLWSFGDTAFRPDVIHRFRSLGWLDWFPVIIDATNSQRIANAALLQCWKEHFPIITDTALLRFVLSCADTVMRNQGEYYPVPTNRVAHNVYAYSEAFRLNSLPTIKPVINCGRELEKIGVGANDWFACFHVREHGYYGDHGNTEKAGKNADIASYADGIRAVLKAGGKAIRMGDPSMRPLAATDGIIDVAHSPEKSPALDTYLCAKARFMVCGASGPASVASTFG